MPVLLPTFTRGSEVGPRSDQADQLQRPRASQPTIWLPKETLGPRESGSPLFAQVFPGSMTYHAWEEAART